MATVHFTGHSYRGADGHHALVLTQPGHYQVSDEKATQLTRDFPHEFTLVLEGQAVEGFSKDDGAKKVAIPTKDEKPARKAS
jgi:hypothetical protein